MELYNNWGNVVNEYYVERYRAIFRERQARLAALTTPQDAQQYSAAVREKVRRAFDFSLWQECPLNTRVVKSFTAGNLRIDNLIFDTEMAFPITANYVRPAKITAPLPAVLVLCGHNKDGKVCTNGRNYVLGLAAQGMAVLALDPIAQGERLIPDTDQWGCTMHNYLNKKLLTLGHWFGEWRAFEGVRGVDWLWANPEVDRTRIYASGCSGGGTLTTWVNALDDRLAGAAPSCYISSWRHIVENELPVDGEQMPPDLSGQGCEMADFLLSVAPRPVLIMGANNDFFDIRGAEETFAEVKNFYRLSGCEDRVEFCRATSNHGLWPEHQAAGKQIIGRWAGLTEAQIQNAVIPDVAANALLVVPEHQTVFSLASMRTPEQLLRDKAQRQTADRPKLPPEQLRARVSSALQLTLPSDLPYYRVLRPGVWPLESGKEKYFSRFLLENSDQPFGVLQMYPAELQFQPRPEKSAVLYLPHANSAAELEFFPELADRSLFAFDGWGIGELEPTSCGYRNQEFDAVYGAEYHYAGLGMMLHESLLGLRVRGVVAALQLLRARGAQNITLFGAGRSSVTAALVALLTPHLVQQCVLINAPKSYAAMFDAIDPILPQALVIPGMLKWSDLPEIYSAIQPEFRHLAQLPDLAGTYAAKKL